MPLNMAIVAKVFSILLPLLIAIAFVTLAERKALGPIQGRVGPNLIGF